MLRFAHRTATRMLVTGILTLFAGATALTLAPTTAFADTGSMESQFVAAMNSARASAGLRPYSVYYDLTSVARQHSHAMASSQTLYHNPSLTSDVQNWQAVGENVGEGPTVADIQSAFMHSPEHRANILDHDFTQVGVGVTVDSNGIVWVTEDFRQPMYSSSSSSSSSSTTTTHHSTSRPASHVAASHVSTTPHRAAPAVSPPSIAKRPARTVHHAVRPAPAQSPQARLLARLTAMRTAAAEASTTDPVAGAFNYLDNVTTLTSAA